MISPRIVIEPHFSVERYGLDRRAIEVTSQTDYLIVHLLSSRIEDLAAGASLLANPREELRTAISAGESEALVIRLAPQMLIETATRLRLHRPGIKVVFRQTLKPISDDRRLRQMIETIAVEMDEAAPGWREVLLSLMQQLAIHLLRAHINVQRADEVELSRVGMVDRRLRRAIEFMHDNCERELRLGEIAAAAYLSSFHFARLFRKITGTTPHAYLAGLRLERARRLLAETDLPISEVGARVGYENQSHFTKIFHEATGLTPRAFREAVRQISD
jgi:AraC family transcriptional regulator